MQKYNILDAKWKDFDFYRARIERKLYIIYMVGQFLNHALGPSDIHAPKYSKNLAKIKLIKKFFKWPFLQKIDKKKSLVILKMMGFKRCVLIRWIHTVHILVSWYGQIFKTKTSFLSLFGLVIKQIHLKSTCLNLVFNTYLLIPLLIYFFSVILMTFLSIFFCENCPSSSLVKKVGYIYI